MNWPSRYNHSSRKSNGQSLWVLLVPLSLQLQKAIHEVCPRSPCCRIRNDHLRALLSMSSYVRSSQSMYENSSQQRLSIKMSLFRANETSKCLISHLNPQGPSRMSARRFVANRLSSRETAIASVGPARAVIGVYTERYRFSC